MIKVLVAVDVQNDFITGSLHNDEAIKVIPNVIAKINAFDGDVIYATKDTHGENYRDTAEGKKLPFVHCVKGTEGWELHPDVQNALNATVARGIDVCYVEKPTFGSYDLVDLLKEDIEYYDDDELDIEFIGFCTDICVVSNVLLVKAAFYENAKVSVDPTCCAGVSPETHNAALLTMKSCQIDGV